MKTYEIKYLYDRNTFLEVKQMIVDSEGNYICSIDWQTYFDNNPSKRPSEEGEEFIRQLCTTLNQKELKNAENK